MAIDHQDKRNNYYTEASPNPNSNIIKNLQSLKTSNIICSNIPIQHKCDVVLKKDTDKTSSDKGHENDDDDGDDGDDDKDRNKNNDKENDGRQQESCCSKMWSCRWKLAYLCFLVRFITGCARHSLSVAILSMVKETNVSVAILSMVKETNVSVAILSMVKQANVSSQAMYNGSNYITVTKMEREFDWSTTFQGLVLSTFNVGATIAPLLLGCLTRRVSERIIILVCLMIGGVSSLLLPPLVKAYDNSIFLTRMFMGLSLAGTDNVFQSLWSGWAPARERASLLSFAYTGVCVAGIITYPICGLIITLGDRGHGWPNIYYAFGTFTMLLAPLWWCSVHDSPKAHPRISDHELQFITEDLAQHDKESNDRLPWKQFLSSPALWAIAFCTFSNKMVFCLLFSFLPYYFYDQLHASLDKSIMLPALPHMGRLAVVPIAGYLSDWMLSKGFSIVVTRKTFQSFACFGSAICAILLIILDNEHALLSVTLLVATLSIQNTSSVAYRINILDIAPRYAGVLGGLIGTVTNVLTMPGPLIAALLLASDSVAGWSMVFLTVAIINVAAGLIFLLFAAGNVQDWAHSTYTPIK